MFICEIIETFSINGMLNKQIYYNNNVGHRVYGPTFSQWYVNGNIYLEEWYIDDMCHRENGPAFRHWDEDGNIRREDWYRDGKYHRVNGQAIQLWREDGVLYYHSCFLYGIEITEEIQEWANTVGISDIYCMTPEESVLFKLTWGNTV